jgi:hypothetical protein
MQKQDRTWCQRAAFSNFLILVFVRSRWILLQVFIIRFFKEDKGVFMEYIPNQPFGWDFKHKRWPLAAYALYLLAHKPWAARIEYEKEIGRYFELQPDSDRVQNVFRRDLRERDLIYAETFRYVGMRELALVRLTDEGRQYCQELGWTPCENEWEALVTRHSGDDQFAHTASVVAFALSARLRGWRTSVLPQTEHRLLMPDVMITNELGQSTYVEVERGTRKYEKWRNYLKYQKRVALCAKTARGRATLVKECKSVGVPGVATDLSYLATTRAPSSQLWIQRWDEQGQDYELNY